MIPEKKKALDKISVSVLSLLDNFPCLEANSLILDTFFHQLDLKDKDNIRAYIISDILSDLRENLTDYKEALKEIFEDMKAIEELEKE